MDRFSQTGAARVLVVEDEPALRRIIVRNLEQRGYRVEQADTVAAALGQCDAELPDVLVLDVNLPDATGWDVLRGLAERGLARPAVVALSAAPPTRSRLAEFQPLTFLPKPFPISALLRAVERAAGRGVDDVARDSRAV